MAKNAKTKYYVVWVGAVPGIYPTWKECEAQVRGYPGARYKGFSTRAEAEKALRQGPVQTPAGVKKPVRIQLSGPGIVQDSISVDAACSGNPGVMEYRGVRTDTGEELFRFGPFPYGTNNIGEFLAIVHALAMLEKRQDTTTVIYSDSRIAQGWVAKGKARTKLPRNVRTEPLHQLIERAESWLKKHSWKNPLLKWDTERWGEIPADFGRK